MNAPTLFHGARILLPTPGFREIATVLCGTFMFRILTSRDIKHFVLLPLLVASLILSITLFICYMLFEPKLTMLAQQNPISPQQWAISALYLLVICLPFVRESCSNSRRKQDLNKGSEVRVA
jgi:hypothetical protein